MDLADSFEEKELILFSKERVCWAAKTLNDEFLPHLQRKGDAPVGEVVAGGLLFAYLWLYGTARAGLCEAGEEEPIEKTRKDAFRALRSIVESLEGFMTEEAWKHMKDFVVWKEGK